MIQRVKTGIGGLDNALLGGIPEKNLVLISGGAGTGKSTLCLQYLIAGALTGEKSLYVTTEQQVFEIEKQALAYGWDLKNFVENGLLKIIYIDVLKEPKVLKIIAEAVEDFSPQRIALDSLSTFSEFAVVSALAEEIIFKRVDSGITNADSTIPKSISEKTMIKRMLATLINELRSLNATILLTSEIPIDDKSLSSDGISEFLTDGVITLYNLGIGSSEFMSLRILKMRYTKHNRNYLFYELSEKGFTILEETRRPFS